MTMREVTTAQFDALKDEVLARREHVAIPIATTSEDQPASGKVCLCGNLSCLCCCWVRGLRKFLRFRVSGVCQVCGVEVRGL